MNATMLSCVKATELMEMNDGSVSVHRTVGEISAKCDFEGANFLALNLANDVITGKYSKGCQGFLYKCN